jgi:hypothetical protein
MLNINVFDGSRQPLTAGVEPLITIHDGNQHQVYREFNKSPSLRLTDLPFFNNFGDNYTVAAWASGFEQAGFTPIRVQPSAPAQVDVMLLKQSAGYNFSQARWDALDQTAPTAKALLTAGTTTSEEAQNRYADLLEHRSAVLACFFNLTTAMSQIHLPLETPMDYIKELIWDELAQDRFFAWADPALVEQVRSAAAQGAFAPEIGTALFHAGATCSFKQVQFGEANVQLTFHENDKKTIDMVDSGRAGEVALYTGNDDNIIPDLLTEFRFPAGAVRFRGGLLGQWAVWTHRAVELLRAVQTCRAENDRGAMEIMACSAALTDANSALFDVRHQFAGCIAGLHEVLRRQGLLAGRWCLDPSEDLSPGQLEEIERVLASYPHLNDDDFVLTNRDRWLK